MDAPDSPFAGYQFITPPDLSTFRRPPRLRELISINFDTDCSESTVLVALARCLGAYCATNDVLLGWQPAHSAAAANTLTAARVNWANANSYDDVLQSLALQETEDSPSGIWRALRLQLDEGLQPFLAVLTPNVEYDHPLVVSFKKDGSERTLRVKYSTLKFHASTAELLAKQVCAVATRIAEYPASSPKHFDVFPDELLSVVSVRTDGSSYTHYPEVRTVADFLPRHDPSVLALEYYPDLYEEDLEVYNRAVQCLTYGELHERSNRFAAYLCAQGLQLEDRVTICLPRGAAFHIAMLGVLKAGGCYVPIDAELPEERQRFINEDSHARLRLTVNNIEEHIRTSESFPNIEINNAQSDSLAYLLYTSGTTGTPKGCLLTHDGFAQAIHALSWFSNQAGPNKRRWPQAGRYLSVASVAFDVHLAEIFVALSLGMTIVAAPRSQLLEDLPRWIPRMRVTHVGIVPSLIEATMHAVSESAELNGDDKGSDKKEQRMDLAYIASGGEKMSDAILERWADHPLITLANFYGPSELTIGCSARLMTSANRKESIGRIFENCSAYVVDENLDLVIRGGVGELLVGGRLVGRGYLNRPDLTEKAFIHISHGSHRERVYRTGDLVRLMPDDTMEILGRIDSQIKLRGVRIESEGVSSVIRKAAVGFSGLTSRTVPDVSTILSRHPQLKADQLVSFVALDSSKSIAHRRSVKPQVLEIVPAGLMNTLKEACVRELASYMRPAHIVPLDFLPLNQNGKTDNKALDALFRATSLDVLGRAGTSKANDDMAGKEHSRDLNEAEAKVAIVVTRYAEVDRTQIKPSSNLFQLGFDSLKLVRFTAELRSSHESRSISVSGIMQHPTIEEIATLLEGTKNKKQVRDSPVDAFSRQWRQEVEEIYGTEKVDKILPTFPVQDGVLYRSADLNTLYVQHVILKINENVDIVKLKSAWATLMSRHEILRTIFHFSSTLVQVVLKTEASELPWEERVIQADNVENFAANFFEGDALQFARTINDNISTSPAFQLSCYRADVGAPTFVTFSIHHAVYDGISLPLLLEDVETFYAGENPRPSASLSQVLDSIYDIEVDEAAAFWRETFSGFEWSKIPKRLASGEVANIVQSTFSTSLNQWERNISQSSLSLQAVLTAAFGVRLGEGIYGIPDVVFGVIRSGRSFANHGLNDARAPLLSIQPMRVNSEHGVDLVQKVQRDIAAALAFEHVPLGSVQKWVQPNRPLFEVLFSVSFDEGNNMSLWEIVESKQPQADYILAVEVVLDRKNGQIRVDCGYTQPLRHGDISGILDNFESTAKSLVEGSHKPEIKRQPEALGMEAIEEDSDTERLSDGPIDEELEDKIKSIVARFLKVEKDHTSGTSSLIALGLDSIKSVGLSRVLRGEGLELKPNDIMRYPSVRHIAARLAQTQRSSEAQTERKEEEVLLSRKRALIASYIDEKRIRLDNNDEVQLYPTTILQAGMLSQTVSSGGHLYVHAFPYKLSSRVDENRFRNAWKRVVRYHSILRTSFHFIKKTGSWIQATHSSVDLKWGAVDGSERKTVLEMSEDFIKELDLSSEDKFAIPPVYMRLLHQRGRNNKAYSTLILVLHHALYDGISISRLSETVWRFYRDEKPTPSPQFVDFLGYFEYQELHGTEYWMKLLRNYKRPTLPRRTGATAESDSISMSVEIPLSVARMNEASKFFDVTVQCFGQASLAKVLSRLYNRRDIAFGHVVSGRNVVHAEDVLGPMISTVPHRLHISAESRILEFIRSIHRQNIAAQNWQHASLRSIQRKLGMSSLWDAIFLFQPIIDDKPEEQNELWSFDDSEDEIAKIQYPLNVEVHQYASHFVVKAACQAGFFDEKGLKTVLQDFSQVFTEIVSEPTEYALRHLDSDDSLRPHPYLNGDVHHPSGTVDTADPRLHRFIDILAQCVDASRDSIQPDTPLISLGVDSISAIQISSRARDVGLKLHAADILRCQIPGDLVTIIDSKDDRAHAPRKKTPPLAATQVDSIVYYLGCSRDSVQDILPASAGMEWLISMWQLSARARFQHVFAFELSADCDEEKLKSAWISLVEKHPILRSTFVSTTGRDVHVVTFLNMPDERLWSHQEVGYEKTAKVVEGVAKELVSQPLSTNLPPCRAVCISGPVSKFFIVHLHHFQYDAWSLRLLIDHLQRLYTGQDAGHSRGLASFLEHCDSFHLKEEQRQYWTSYLPSSFEPSLLPKRVSESMSSRDRLFHIDHTALHGVSHLRQLAQDSSVSLNAVFLACWARVQAKHSNTRAATFGLWHSGRTGLVDGIESLPVPCMNVLPVHIDSLNIHPLELAKRIETMLRQRSATVEQTHLRDVNRWIGGTDDRVIMNVFVNILTVGKTDDRIIDNFLSPVDLPYFIPKLRGEETHMTAEKLDICNIMEDALLVDFVVHGDAVAMSVEYRDDYLDEETSQELVREWIRLVEGTFG